jgi:hypothetical protein
MALNHHTTLREHGFGRQVVVPYFRKFFCIAIVKVDDVGVIIVFRVWDEVFSRKSCSVVAGPRLFDFLIKLVLCVLMDRAIELFIS